MKYGLIGQFIAVEGKRNALAQILRDASVALPGCLSYVVALDTADENGIWVTEVWKSEAAHQASLSLPSVKDAIAQGRPLIADFGARHITQPI